jgi:hypothetical protein
MLTWFPEGVAGLDSADPQSGATTTVALRVERQSSVRRVRQEVVNTETDGVPDHEAGAWVCPDRVEADASFALTTADGRLDEIYGGRLVLGLVSDEIAETPRLTLEIGGLPARDRRDPREHARARLHESGARLRPGSGRGSIRIFLKPQQGAAAVPTDVFLARRDPRWASLPVRSRFATLVRCRSP